MEGFASMECTLTWQSAGVKHQDGYFFPRINFWRDYIPPILEQQLEQQGLNARCSAHFSAGEMLPEYQKNQLIKTRTSQFDRNFVKHRDIEPRSGRFYPGGILNGVSSLFKESRQPVRCTAIEGDSLYFDLNHPLAAMELDVELLMRSHSLEKTDERGGRSLHVIESSAENGPGMQARRTPPVEFFADAPFERLDPWSDTDFYTQPRLIQHIDATASSLLRDLHARLLQPGMKVLDLMSSWTSHLPDELALNSLVGLGMNQAELAANPRLTERLLHDLNAEPVLPLASAQFDAVICSLSVEYLTQPFAVFAELARVLNPNGLLLLSFSNRWFPTKAIQIWSDLHEFERQGLVLEYFSRSGSFHQLETYSLRNLPRPQDDKYYSPSLLIADPLFAVWGRRI